MNNTDLIARLQNDFTKLSKGQKRIAKYIIENYDKAAFMTAGALGRAVDVSESTVVRFACAMGYEGYPKLQKHLQELIRNKLTNVQRLNLMEGLDPDHIVETVFRQDRANLASTFESFDVGLMERVVDRLVGAKTIYVLGYRSSAPLAQFLVYYLGYILGSIQHVQCDGDIFSQLIHAGEGDVVVCMGFPRYAKQTVSGSDFAKKRGAHIIAITDNKLSPLYELADDCIFTRTDMNSFVDSLVAPLCVINALIVMVGLRKKGELISNFMIMENLWMDNNTYAHENFMNGEESDEQA